MKKVVIASFLAVGGLGGVVTIVAARFEATIVPKTFVGVVDVGGRSKLDAAKLLRMWWEGERTKKLTLVNSIFQKQLPPMTAGQLGISVDDQASVADLPMTDLVQAVTQRVEGAPEQKKFDVKFKSVGVGLDGLKKTITEAIGPTRPAKVIFAAGKLVRKPEVSRYQLDDAHLSAAVVAALEADGKVQVPLKEAPKRISDEELAKITDVMSEYSTHFPSYQTSRNTNIRLAAAKLNGVVLMPGDKISFNKTVGQRTVEDGYREAPVLKNGKHDRGIGGGICQVSTTMYNATLLADLKILKRQNHSIPSVYVPVGRDATVDWPDLDLIVQNPYDKPIAISSEYQSGKITFRVLGIKDQAMVVKLMTNNHQVWSRGTQMIIDKSLPPGTRKVIEKGSRAHSIDTYRIVLQNGVEIRRELLNHSSYNGSPATIAYNPTPKAAPGFQWIPQAPKPAGTAPVPIGG